MADELVHYAVTKGVATVTLDSPHNRNALSAQLRRELRAHLGAAERDPDARVIVLDHTGPVFCAGMDLKEAGAPETPAERRDRLRSSRDIEQLAALPQPTIAAINGYALGGGLEMALACDLRVVAESAQVGLTELVHGLVPGGGGTQRLPRLIGMAKAAELLFTGRRLTGSEAEAWGLVNRCVAFDDLHKTVAELAATIAEKDGRALRYAKELLRKSQEVSVAAGADAELDALLTLMAERNTAT